MKSWRLLVFALVGLAQLAVPASLIWKREQTLRHGSVWKFRTAPVDPVDAFRGRYVALEFEAEGQTISPPPNASYHQTVFVTLRQNPEGFAEIDQVSYRAGRRATISSKRSSWENSLSALRQILGDRARRSRGGSRLSRPKPARQTERLLPRCAFSAATPPSNNFISTACRSANTCARTPAQSRARCHPEAGEARRGTSQALNRFRATTGVFRQCAPDVSR